MTIYDIYQHPTTKKYKAVQSTKPYFISWLLPIVWQLSKKIWFSAFWVLIGYILVAIPFLVDNNTQHSTFILEFKELINNFIEPKYRYGTGLISVLIGFTIVNIHNSKSHIYYKEVLLNDGYTKINEYTEANSEKEALEDFRSNKEEFPINKYK